MRVIVPAPVTLSSTNVEASAYSEWSSGTNYSEGQTVKYTTAQTTPYHEFESLKNSNSGNAPQVGGSEWWLDLGATNQHRMIDGLNNSRTIATDTSGNIVVTLAVTTKIHALGLIGLRNVGSVTVEQIVDGLTINTATASLTTGYGPVGWYSWLFGEFTTARSYSADIIGIYSDQSLKITLTGQNGVAECGLAILGKAYELGCTEWGAQPGLKDFSTFEEDEFGNTQFVPRQNKRLGDYTLWVPTNDFDRVFGIFEDLIGSLALFDANNATISSPTTFDSIRAYGKIESVSVGLAYGVTPIDIRILGMN